MNQSKPRIKGREHSLISAVNLIETSMSVDVVGTRGSGRSSFLAALKHRLETNGWTVHLIRGVASLRQQALAAINLAGLSEVPASRRMESSIKDATELTAMPQRRSPIQPRTTAVARLYRRPGRKAEAAGQHHIILNSLRDADGLTAALAKRGIAATVTFGGTDTGISDVKVYTPEEVAAGKAGDVLPQPPTGDQDGLSGEELPIGCPDAASGMGVSVEIMNEKTIIDVPEGALPVGEKLMITTSGDDRAQAAIDVAWTTPEGQCMASAIFVNSDL